MKTNFTDRYFKAGRVVKGRALGGGERGVTLIELLTALGIMTILVALAFPSYNSVIRDNRVLSGANSIAAGVALARSESIKRGRTVTLCPSANGTACDTSQTFDKGWVVIVELPGATSLGAMPTLDTTIGAGGILMTGSAIQKSLVTKLADPGRSWIRFTARGMATEEVTLQVKPETCSAGYAWQQLTVGITGRVSITKQTC